MIFRSDGFGDLFDDGEEGVASNMEEVVEHMTHLMQEHDMPLVIALDSMLNLLKPGATDSSHDVLHHFYVAMYALDHGEVAKNVKCLWFTAFPWGMGFHFGFEQGYDVGGLTKDEKRAVVKSLAAILNAVGYKAEVTDKDLLRVSRQPGEENGETKDIDVLVTQFREELDSELGPDAPSNDLPRSGPDLRDWLRRWMPDQE